MSSNRGHAMNSLTPTEKKFEDDNHRRSDKESKNYWVVEDQNLVANTMWLNCRGIGVSKGVKGSVQHIVFIDWILKL